MKTIAILAVQGAFIEHERMLHKLGCECIELRQAADSEKPFNALVLPGGESTAQAKMLRELGMLEPLRQRIAEGMPVLGTCAGLILLAESVEKGIPATGDPNGLVAAGPTAAGAFGTLPVTVQRNAYGRQLGSFRTTAPCAGLLSETEAADIPMTFIRAPFIKEAHGNAQVLAQVDGRIVAVRSGNQLGVAFHPELDADTRIHELLISLI